MKKIILLFFILLFLNFNQVFAIVEYQEEIIELRTANRKIYDLGNNTYRYEYYSTPIHYFDKTEYIEYNQDLTYDSKTTKYTTEKSNYSVGLPNSNSDNTNITLNYYDLFHIEINYFGKASIIEDDINTKANVYASYVSNQTNHFMIQLNNGSWAGKQGTLPSVYYTMVFPSIMDWNAYTSQQFDEYFENFYDSSTIYFAISGGSYEW